MARPKKVTKVVEGKPKEEVVVEKVEEVEPVVEDKPKEEVVVEKVEPVVGQADLETWRETEGRKLILRGVSPKIYRAKCLAATGVENVGMFD